MSLTAGPNYKSAHIDYLEYFKKDLYRSLKLSINGYFRSKGLFEDQIQSIWNIRHKLAYFIDHIELYNHHPDDTAGTARLKRKIEELEGVNCVYHLVLQQLKTDNELVYIIEQERKLCSLDRKLLFEKRLAKDSLQFDLQDLTRHLDWFKFESLEKIMQFYPKLEHNDLSLLEKMAKERTTKLHHDLDLVEERFDMGIKAMTRQLATLHMIRPKLEHTDLEHVKNHLSYIFFALRHWISLIKECSEILRTMEIDAKEFEFDDKIENLKDKFNKLLKQSFIIATHPESICVLPAPSSTRIIKQDKEWITAIFLLQQDERWLTVASKAGIYLVGHNQYSPHDTINKFDRLKPSAYKGNDLYRENKGVPQHSVQQFNKDNEVKFPKVSLLANNLVRTSKDTSTHQKRKFEETRDAPEDIYSFVIHFDIKYNLYAPWRGDAISSSAVEDLMIQTCSGPMAILVHASQKPQAEGRLFWCKFNDDWTKPLDEPKSVTPAQFKALVSQYTEANFGRRLTDQETDYFIEQLPQHPGAPILQKSVLKDDACYTCSKKEDKNAPKRPSLWLWYYDTLDFISMRRKKCKNSSVQRHWKEGRICFMTRKHANQKFEQLKLLEPTAYGAIIRAAESMPKTLNMVVLNDSYGISEHQIDTFDNIILRHKPKITKIWEETSGCWVDVAQVCQVAGPLNILYKDPLSVQTDDMEPASPRPDLSQYAQSPIRSPFSPSPMSAVPGNYGNTPCGYPNIQALSPSYYNTTPQHTPQHASQLTPQHTYFDNNYSNRATPRPHINIHANYMHSSGMHSPIQSDGLMDTQLEQNIINEMQHTHLNNMSNNTYN